MEYTICIDVAGNDIEFDYELDDGIIHNYVTNGDCSYWATEHFEECVDVHEYITHYLENLSEEELIALVAPIMGIEND